MTFNDEYECPICRHGKLAGITLMDAYACSFCRHIFTANLSEQIVRVEDSSTPMAWRWSGKRWRSVQSTNADLTLVVWICCIAVIVLPPVVVWVPAQIFPPLEGSKGAWFPNAWFVAIVVAHLTIGGWLLSEHYQWRPYVMLRDRMQRMFPES
ncbi:hypothetical protein IQ266_20595 [filamentous cyanobacterium LEGE 11480]|uniref:Uncharacterized protein n=1 Tax=Romeriopsis navalis LEGE 11480 TaxID=2777977 RepID=A0A928VQZ6_9CYAN|nr:hypothetical protein [Romeriopsis navalis LEGE 11480]